MDAVGDWKSRVSDEHALEYEEYLQSGLPFPGNMSPDALFAIFVVAPSEEHEEAIRTRCLEHGREAVFFLCPSLGRVFCAIGHPESRSSLIFRSEYWHDLLNGSTDEPDDDSGRFVYFLAAPEVGRLKIGVANDVQKRIRALETASPVSLELVAVETGGVQREAELHDMFSKQRVRGEWFTMDSELSSYIRGISGNVGEAV